MSLPQHGAPRHPPRWTGSVGFACLVGLLASLGAQVLVGAVLPISLVAGLADGHGDGGIVLIAGITPLWPGDTVVRALAFGCGALIGCLVARSHPWRLVAGLVALALLATAFAQFPGPGGTGPLLLWAAAAPVATLGVALPYRRWSRRV